jgi:hypothetical protein
MTKKEWKRERTRQTYRLYGLLKPPYSEEEGIEEKVLECIKRGADLKRRDFWLGIPIWCALHYTLRPSIIKILYEHGGLEETVSLGRISDNDINGEEISAILTLEWILSKNYGRISRTKNYSEIIDKEYYMNHPDRYEEDIKILQLKIDRFEEYKKIFDMSKFDLDLYEKMKRYDSDDNDKKSDTE